MTNKNIGVKMENKKGTKMVSIITTIVLIIAYFMFTDEELGLISNLNFGFELVLTLRVVILTMIGVVFISTYPDVFKDAYIRDEQELTNLAISTSQGAGMYEIARAIKILAYSIMFSASVIAVLMII